LLGERPPQYLAGTDRTLPSAPAHKGLLMTVEEVKAFSCMAIAMGAAAISLSVARSRAWANSSDPELLIPKASSRSPETTCVEHRNTPLDCPNHL
jgi:hypothetical protein